MAATIELNKTTATLMDWTLLDDNASGAPWTKTDQLDISSEISCLLHVDMAACNTLAIATAGEAIFWGKAGGTNDDWHEFTRRTYGTTANGKIDLSNGLNSGEVSCSMGDTTGIETRGQKVFLKHSTLTSSQVNVLVDYSNDVALYFEFSAATDFTNTADAMCPTGSAGDGCAQWTVRVPEEFWAARVTFHNDDADVNYACRVQYNFITDYTSV